MKVSNAFPKSKYVRSGTKFFKVNELTDVDNAATFITENGLKCEYQLPASKMVKRHKNSSPKYEVLTLKDHENTYVLNSGNELYLFQTPNPIKCFFSMNDDNNEDIVAIILEDGNTVDLKSGRANVGAVDPAKTEVLWEHNEIDYTIDQVPFPDAKLDEFSITVNKDNRLYFIQKYKGGVYHLISKRDAFTIGPHNKVGKFTEKDKPDKMKKIKSVLRSQKFQDLVYEKSCEEIQEAISGKKKKKAKKEDKMQE